MKILIAVQASTIQRASQAAGESRLRTVIRSIMWTFLLLVTTFFQVGCNADTQVLGQDRSQVEPGRATPRHFLVDGKQVEAWVASPPPAIAHNPQGFVLFFTGQDDRADRYVANVADSWNQWPVEVWGLNYPGSGGSDGPNQIARVGSAALALYDTVARQARGRPIFLEAVSFGTTAALDVAAHRSVAGIILTNPPPLRQLIIGEYSWWNLGLISHVIAAEIPADLDSIRNASQCTAPLLVLSSEKDLTVPPKYQRMVINAFAGPKQIICMRGCDHDDPAPPSAERELAIAKQRIWQMTRN